ncbi:hypothetical protein [Methylobacter sp. BBA5.1]|uniref:hypothetical protein n=1 Tax=Methylobacter sp. BBA5.1 TaxID=1495064 RepID=UPI0005652882|nr:hypothetical protein [Methylobacter sp. BBA5.1]
MAARTVRCFLSNQTDTAFTYVSDEHDHGQFTDPWYPPAVIAPGSIGQWRSESDGFMTGTEGNVRYSTSVPDADGGHTEFIEVHWDNPFIGQNNASISVVEDFTNKPSATLKSASYIQTNGAPPPNLVKMTDGDVEAWIDGILFPPYIIANWNTASFNDANAFYAVKAGTNPQFIGEFSGPPTGKKSSKLNTKAIPAEWAGRWMSAVVSLTIVSRGKKAMTAYITDRSTNPPLQFQQDFELGALTWVADHMLVHAIKTQFAAGSEPLDNVLRIAATQTVSSLNAQREESAFDIFQKTALSTARSTDVHLNTSRLEKSSKAITSFVGRSRGSVALMNGVHLSLYDVFTGGQKTDAFLKYERHGVLGVVAYGAVLDYVIDLH